MSAIITAGGCQIDETVKIHRERSRLQDYVSLGRVVWINLAVDVGNRRLTPQDRLLLGKIDYLGDGPMLARSNDYHDVLLPFGAKPFPDVPDPLWESKTPTQAQLANPSWKRPRAPMLSQAIEDRACARHENGEGTWAIFQPVIEVWFRRFEIADYGVVKFHPFLDTTAALMINVGNREAFFFGGRPEFLRCR